MQRRYPIARSDTRAVAPLGPCDPAASTGRADLLGPGDPARERRLEWAKLLKRVFALDVLVCARCTGPMGETAQAAVRARRDVADREPSRLESASPG
jgi:hypothetical protein